MDIEGVGKFISTLRDFSEIFLYRMILIGLEVCDDAIGSDFSCHSEFGNIHGFFHL